VIASHPHALLSAEPNIAFAEHAERGSSEQHLTAPGYSSKLEPDDDKNVFRAVSEQAPQKKERFLKKDLTFN